MKTHSATSAAIKTLQALGYTYCGGELWKPPIAQAPNFDLIDRQRARIAALEAELVAEAGRTAEQKLRANQMAEQHRMQAAMNAEARKALVEETEATDGWRRLALQFDGHRMQALAYLKALLKGETELEAGARGFIASPPIPAEQVLAERIAAIAQQPVHAMVEAQAMPGWKLVPVEPTDAMAVAAVKVSIRNPAINGVAQYKAMLEAAPAHPHHSPEVGKMVTCSCGDQFPIDSYGGGFLDAKGKCFGCDAEADATNMCWCTTCRPITLEDMRFVVCPECGNKRCPRAHNHDLACTGSNAVGQVGSSWEHVKPKTGLNDGD